MNPIKNEPAPDRQWVDLLQAYEALRQQILTQRTVGRSELELALLMRQGMAAWICAWQNCCREKSVESSAGHRASPAAMAAPLTDLHGEITMLLASMVLNVSQQQGSSCQ
jgi:hypothetical protein